jgi:hypothetical protein
LSLLLLHLWCLRATSPSQCACLAQHRCDATRFVEVHVGVDVILRRSPSSTASSTATASASATTCALFFVAMLAFAFASAATTSAHEQHEEVQEGLHGRVFLGQLQCFQRGQFVVTHLHHRAGRSIQIILVDATTASVKFIVFVSIIVFVFVCFLLFVALCVLLSVLLIIVIVVLLLSIGIVFVDEELAVQRGVFGILLIALRLRRRSCRIRFPSGLDRLSRRALFHVTGVLRALLVFSSADISAETTSDAPLLLLTSIATTVTVLSFLVAAVEWTGVPGQLNQAHARLAGQRRMTSCSSSSSSRSSSGRLSSSVSRSSRTLVRFLALRKSMIARCLCCRVHFSCSRVARIPERVVVAAVTGAAVVAATAEHVSPSVAVHPRSPRGEVGCGCRCRCGCGSG